MIKQILYKVFSVSLSLIVLFSTLSLTVEKHYCGPFLVDVALFKSAKKCGMDLLMSMDQDDNFKSCCNDEVEVIQGQDELKLVSFEALDFSKQLLLYTNIYSYNNLFISLPKQIIPHKDYSPPNLIKDIQVKDQVFLI